MLNLNAHSSPDLPVIVGQILTKYYQAFNMKISERSEEGKNRMPAAHCRLIQADGPETGYPFFHAHETRHCSVPFID